MSEIPTTPKAFERWLAEQKPSMGPELYALGYDALMTLKLLDMNSPATVIAMQVFAPEAYEAMLERLRAFGKAWHSRAR